MLCYDVGTFFLTWFSFFHFNVISNNKSFLQILIRNRATDLDARMHDGTTPLILAARLAVEGMVEELINCHADVNAIDDFGNACSQLLCKEVCSDQISVFCLLSEKTAIYCKWKSL